MVDEASLVRQLKGMGWPVQSHGAQTLRSDHETPEGAISIYIRITDNWLVASVIPFLSTKGDTRFELSRWLLRMNSDMVQAKFCYDEDDDVVLSIEWPTEALDTSEIRGGLKSLLGYAIEYRGILRRASS